MSRLRRVICEKISEITKIDGIYHELEVPSKKELLATGKLMLHWPVTSTIQEKLQKLLPSIQLDKGLIKQIRLLPAAGKQTAKVEFQLQPSTFAETVLQDDLAFENISSCKSSHMVFEYSSPNIAKPFHVGHLRSTIIGNTLANLHEQLGYKVTKLNYLGDWGTQFGMLQVGVEMQGVTDEQMCRSPIETLYNAYVAANAAAKQDSSVIEKARRYFSALETGENESMARKWQQYRQYTVTELERVYARLGVHFDEYHWESQYSQQQIGEILTKLAQHELLLDETDGRKVVAVDGRRVPIIKSDGSTLYLARDVAALVDRFQRYHFDHIYYVVDNGQADHFNACFKTTSALCADIPLERLTHVKFGRIHGMSTRSGNAVFLSDVLNEAKDIMLKKQLQSPTTKVLLTATDSDHNQVSDVLGVSAVVINDLKQRRQRDYNFDWHKALQVNGDTGIKLQYTHCRLYSLLEHFTHVDVSDLQVQIEHVSEPEAQDLLLEIARFEQAVWQAKQHLEPCVLVNYLFTLCNCTSRALKHLSVKYESNSAKQQHRILLFSKAKKILKIGMQILGLQPLNQM